VVSLLRLRRTSNPGFARLCDWLPRRRGWVWYLRLLWCWPLHLLLLLLLPLPLRPYPFPCGPTRGLWGAYLVP
jgi:hypothetical protein